MVDNPLTFGVSSGLKVPSSLAPCGIWKENVFPEWTMETVSFSRIRVFSDSILCKSQQKISWTIDDSLVLSYQQLWSTSSLILHSNTAQ